MAQAIRDFSSSIPTDKDVRPVESSAVVKQNTSVPLRPVTPAISMAAGVGPLDAMASQLKATQTIVAAVSSDLKKLDAKWHNQLSGFQETAYVTAEAVVEFENELDQQKASIGQFVAEITKQQQSLNARCGVLANAVQGKVDAFDTYRQAVDKKLTLLYAGLSALSVVLLATIGFVVFKL